MGSEKITNIVLQLMKSKDYTPQSAEQLFRMLEIPEKQYASFRETLKELLQAGTIVRLKKDRLCLPADADLATGTIYFRQSGSAFLVPEGAGKRQETSIQIRAEDTGTAMHKDRVVVRLIPANKKRRYQRQSRGRKSSGGDNSFEGGRVIRILERARETLTGTLKRSRLYHYVIPDDPRITQDILVPDPARTNLDPKPAIDDKVLVKLLDWEQRHLNPQGEIVEILGKTHTPGAEYKALLHLYSLEPEFPGSVVDEVAGLPKNVQKAELVGRLDMRNLRTLTIDPDDAKDFDDALSLRILDDGQIEIAVHIADVSAYVRPGTALDKESRKRGNSTYLVGTVIPMLPHTLSNGLCSLVEDEDRLTKTAIHTFSPRGKLLETRFVNSVIRSNKRLTYRQAYALMKEGVKGIRRLPVPPAHQTGSTGRAISDMSDEELETMAQDIRQLWKVAAHLRARRMSKGSLDLDMPEMKIFVDKEGYADRIERVESDESHQLVEEFMLITNEAVDRSLSHAGIPLIHRVHDKPDSDKLDELGEQLALHGVETGDLTSRKEVTKLLKTIKEHPQGYTLRIEFLRSLKQACYRAEADGHYGLNKANYTHFTSPIRRYCDLVVHRILDNYMQKNSGQVYHAAGGSRKGGKGEKKAGPAEKGKAATRRIKNKTAHQRSASDTSNRKESSTDGGMFYPKGELVRIAEHISRTEQNSTEAERESVKIKLLEYFEKELRKSRKTKFEAVITEIKNHGMFVELTESMAYGLIHISTLQDDLYIVSSDTSRMVGRRTGKKFEAGQVVYVTVSKIDRFKRQIDFRIAS